jgi:hypothetical protein
MYYAPKYCIKNVVNADFLFLVPSQQKSDNKIFSSREREGFSENFFSSLNSSSSSSSPSQGPSTGESYPITYRDHG